MYNLISLSLLLIVGLPTLHVFFILRVYAYAEYTDHQFANARRNKILDIIYLNITLSNYLLSFLMFMLIFTKIRFLERNIFLMSQ